MTIKTKPSRGGKIVRLVRNVRGYSQDELATLTGFARNSISNWETGKARPAFDDVEVIVKSLHFTLSQLEDLENAA